MDLDTYDQISLSAEEVGDAREFLKENIEVEILFINESPVTVELPNFIELQIAGKTGPPASVATPPPEGPSPPPSNPGR